MLGACALRVPRWPLFLLLHMGMWLSGGETEARERGLAPSETLLPSVTESLRLTKLWGTD